MYSSRYFPVNQAHLKAFTWNILLQQHSREEANMLGRRYWSWEWSWKLKHSILEMIIRSEGKIGRRCSLHFLPKHHHSLLLLLLTASMIELQSRWGRGGWIFFAWRKRGIGRGVSKRKGKRREMLLDVWVGQMEGEWWKTENDEKENKGTRWWNAGVAERCHFPPPVYSDRRLLGSHRVPLSLLPLTQTHTCSKNNIHTV